MNDLVNRRIIVVEPMDDVPTQFDLLRKSGCDLVIGPYVSEGKKGYTSEQLIEIGNTFDAIIGMSREKFPREILMQCNRVRTIGKFGIGVDHIDLEAAAEKGILITNTPGQNTMTVAEYAIGMILAVLKNIPRNDRYLRNMHWRDMSTAGWEIYRSTVGLVGFGGIGREMAKRLQGWECKVIAYDPYVTQAQADEYGYGVQMVNWDTLFQTADIVSLHLPCTKETIGIIGRREFEMMKDNAILVNTARGPIVDHDALAWALVNKKIGGAGIDTHAHEPILPTDPLLPLDERVILTPHSGGWATSALARLAERAALNTVQALSGQLPDCIANPAVIPLWKKRFNIF